MLTCDLRLGDWRVALADVAEVAAVIADPPYGKRTRDGNADVPNRTATLDGYACWTPEDVAEFVAFWSPRTRDWMACMTSDDLITPFRDAYSDAGRLDFAPVPILQHRPRIQGDGPGSGAVYLMVARPRQKRFTQWGSLPPWYMSTPDKTGIVNGAKPLALMQAIVCDYSRPGDLVCDPTGGGFTTAMAARAEGRRCVSSEIDPDTYAKASARIALPWTPSLWHAEPAAVQAGLFDAR